jgi:hypothetical protein
VIDTLKWAFVQGMLTKDEFDVRAGQAFASRTYAELAALTADIGPGPIAAPSPRPPARPAEAGAKAEPGDSSQNTVVNAGACVALAILVLNAAFIVGNSGVFLAAVAAVAVALFIAVARMIYLRNEKRSRQQ